jgi:fructan beta-fructosidase
MTTAHYNETYRGQFHFSARENWINDPNGLVYYKGRYHLFFQHNPFGTNWGNMTWGHAVSADLVHWRQLANALEPDELGTMFSGSAVVDWTNTSGFQTGDKKVIVAIYTSAGGTSPQSQDKPFTQCIAYSTDGGDTFTKFAGNPVIGHIVKENRDPKVVWHTSSGRWVMVLFKDGITYAFFASADLKTWQHLQDIDLPGCSECPDFFPIAVEGEPGETHWVFTAANGQYLVGDFDGQRFSPLTTQPLQVDFGANYYAVQTYSDVPDGRRIQMSWMAGGTYPDMPFYHQMSFPCEIKLARTPSGLRLTRWPVAEITGLYTSTREWHDIALTDSPMDISQSDALDMQLDCEVTSRAKISLNVRGEHLILNTIDGTLTCLGKVAPLAPVDGRVSIRVLVDRASIEVFGNGGQISMTSCFIPDPTNRLTALSGIGATARSLIVHELGSAWK